MTNKISATGKEIIYSTIAFILIAGIFIGYTTWYSRGVDEQLGIVNHDTRN